MLPLILYVASIVAANVMITVFGFWPVGFGLMAPAGVYAAGVSLGLRDEVQERYGRLGTMSAIVAGALISAFLSPQLAMASGVAFLVSEMADMVVYTRIRERSWLGAVLASNVVGSAIDSALFLWLAGIPLSFVLGQVVGKWWATLAVLPLLWLWKRSRRAQIAERAVA